MIGKCRKYFPGGNTPDGFVSYYGDILPQDKANRIFCIKGGPGTGKSTMMKQIGGHYLKQGMDVDFLKCSSDPLSLDGIVIKDTNTAVIDGTAPHIIDPINPGAVDDIINLGEYLDDKVLRNNKDMILSMTEDISKTFEYAYVYLKCADTFNQYLNRVYKKYVSEKELYKFILSIDLPEIRKRNGAKQRYFASSITSAGMVEEFGTLTNGLNNIYMVEVPDGYKVGELMKFLSNMMIDRGYDIEELYCPMHPSNIPEHIISVDADLAIVTCNSFHKKELFGNNKIKEIININTASIDYNDRQRISEMINSVNKNLEKAISILNEAKKKHDDLEKYYIEAMDFSAVEGIKNKVIQKIDMPVV